MIKVFKSVSNTISKTCGAIDNLVDAIAGITGMFKETVEASILEQRIEQLQELKQSAKIAGITNDDEDEEAEETAPSSTEGEAETPETEASVDDILGNILPESETEESAVESEEETEQSTVEPEEEADTKPETAEEPAAETPEAPPATEDSSEETSEEDMWAEAFTDQEATEQSAAEETAEEETTEETAEGGEEKSEEDMWAEAFADQESTEETAEETAKEDDEEGEDTEEDEEDAAAELGITEDDYEDGDDDYEEEEEEDRIKIGPISVPDTRAGKLMLAGGVLGVLVTVGGAYFAWQTFVPPELTEVAKPETEVPEGLTPKPDKEQAPAASEEISGKEKAQPEQAKKLAKPAVLGEVGEDTKSEIAQELARSDTLSESLEVVEENSEGLLAALSPEAKMVKFSTIMPIAFDVNDIRVLSFTLKITFTDEASAQVMQSALPFFEEATVKTVERFLAKKFYNDILYVKEKLEKRLQTAYNKKIDSDGRVKKIKFEDFVIQ